MPRHRAIGKLLRNAVFVLLMIFSVWSCSNNESDEGEDIGPPLDLGEDIGPPLDFGDASWEKAPLTPPGGDRTGGNDRNGDDSDYSVDGDSPDGDDGYDAPDPGEECPPVEPCPAPAWCEDESTLDVCTISEDPQDPYCMIRVIEAYVCEGQTVCLEPDEDTPDVEQTITEAGCYPLEEEPEDGDIEDGDAGDGDEEHPEGEEAQARIKKDDAPMCPDSQEPAVFYMSNDDSNSMASPILCRAKIREGSFVYADDVRIYEFLNYYDLTGDNPDNLPAAVSIQMRRTDAEQGEFTLLLSAQGKRIASSERRPLNLVFSLDTSGSMSGEPIQRVRDILRAIATVLDEGDVISVVTWNHTQNVMLDTHQVQGPNDPVLLDLANMIRADGSTNLHSGLMKAYELARASYRPERINRVIMISDGGANTGITDIATIADAAADEDGEGIYMVGVGVETRAAYYNDALMDAVTDAGKGAYLYVDSVDEARRMFADPERFLSIVEVSARNVRMELTMPWYFGIKKFHGEEYSRNPEEVEPQHLAPNDAMNFHQVIQACSPELVTRNARIKAKVTYVEPITREEMSDEMEISIGDLVQKPADRLRKADVVVSYAQSLIVIADLRGKGERDEARRVAEDMTAWLRQAADELADVEVDEMANLMGIYHNSL